MSLKKTLQSYIVISRYHNDRMINYDTDKGISVVEVITNQATNQKSVDQSVI